MIFFSTPPAVNNKMSLVCETFSVANVKRVFDNFNDGSSLGYQQYFIFRKYKT